MARKSKKIRKKNTTTSRVFYFYGVSLILGFSFIVVVDHRPAWLAVGWDGLMFMIAMNVE